MYNKQLDSFIRAAELKSFSKAANALFITPTSLIQQINLLEQHIGIQLFIRSPRGVTLTNAGESLYQDAKNIIRLSNNAIERAQMLEKNSNYYIRIGTSLLTKCRYLPDFWSRIIEMYPNTEIKLVSQKNPEQANHEPLSELGITYEMQEGLYLSEFYRGKCNFLEFSQVPLCAAMSSTHPLNNLKTVHFKDLKGQTVLLLRRGISKSFDLLRDSLEQHPEIKIQDIDFYDINVFISCEMNKQILLTPEIWKDIHPTLHIHPLENNFTVPYGLIYALELSNQAQLLVSTIKDLMRGNYS